MTSATIKSTFNAFRDEIDGHNDRRERLIKASRDITNHSKKAIFLLHRIVLEPPQDGSSALRAAKLGREKLQQVTQIYTNMKDEFAGDLFWRYERQISPGLQEYIEALSFVHFLEHTTLITLSQVQQTLCDSHGDPLFPLTISDYLLGISDLTGELMRYAISGLSIPYGRTQANETLAFVRNCKADFDLFTALVPHLSKKQFVTAQSLKKIEEAAYAIVVRTSEYELTPEMLDDILAQTLVGSKRKDRGDDDEYQEL